MVIHPADLSVLHIEIPACTLVVDMASGTATCGDETIAALEMVLEEGSAWAKALQDDSFHVATYYDEEACSTQSGTLEWAQNACGEHVATCGYLHIDGFCGEDAEVRWCTGEPTAVPEPSGHNCVVSAPSALEALREDSVTAMIVEALGAGEEAGFETCQTVIADAATGKNNILTSSVIDSAATVEWLSSTLDQAGETPEIEIVDENDLKWGSAVAMTLGGMIFGVCLGLMLSRCLTKSTTENAATAAAVAAVAATSSLREEIMHQSSLSKTAASTLREVEVAQQTSQRPAPAQPTLPTAGGPSAFISDASATSGFLTGAGAPLPTAAGPNDASNTGNTSINLADIQTQRTSANDVMGASNASLFV